MKEFNDGEMDSIVTKIREFIVNSVKEAGADGVIIGLSGGLDSAVVATLAAPVVDVYGIIMPEMGVNSEEDEDLAVDLVNKLNHDSTTKSFVNCIVAPINEIIGSVMQLGFITKSDEGHTMGYANLKPRIRMIINYLVANENNYIVAGTGNKSELLYGYFTKYGDGGVDILPIGGLYKTQVKQIAKYLDIDNRVVKKPPSAGLWKGQTDEQEMGVNYTDLDQILELLESGERPEKVYKKLDVGFDTVIKVWKNWIISEHKRTMPPMPDGWWTIKRAMEA